MSHSRAEPQSNRVIQSGFTEGNEENEESYDGYNLFVSSVTFCSNSDSEVFDGRSLAKETRFTKRVIQRIRRRYREATEQDRVFGSVNSVSALCALCDKKVFTKV